MTIYVVPKKKIKYYLLNTKSKDGRSKATFFKSIGLNSERKLREALINIASHNKISKSIETEYGTKIEIRGIYKLKTIGITYKICTIWLRESTLKKYKFITAYPLP